MIKYEHAGDIKQKLLEISKAAGHNHDFSRVVCIRSRGSKAVFTIARCHALPRVMQTALGVRPHYVIEVISERFDKMDEEEKTMTLIHELLHIPKAFGGGLKGHKAVNRKAIDRIYRDYTANRNV